MKPGLNYYRLIILGLDVKVQFISNIYYKNSFSVLSKLMNNIKIRIIDNFINLLRMIVKKYSL